MFQIRFKTAKLLSHRHDITTNRAFFQVAAVLANMAASADCREEVTRNGGIKVLLHFLDATHVGSNGHHAHAQQQADHSQNNQNDDNNRRPEDFAQMAATERVLQKSAIALSR